MKRLSIILFLVVTGCLLFSGVSLAKSFTISPDGKIYTFKLREDVKFHNGRKLTAEDIKFSIERF